VSALPCALGFAPHSGWTAVVVVGGTVVAPRVLVRERLELADSHLEGSRQPYHALEELALTQARERLAQFERSAARLALAGLRALLERTASMDHEVRSAALLDATRTPPASLEAILASHALIHSADGHHFRIALASACEALGLSVSWIGPRELEQRAEAVLRQTATAVGAAVAALGRGLGAPWGADQKSAALLAWLKLAEVA
jgi:hypothetical protein